MEKLPLSKIIECTQGKLLRGREDGIIGNCVTRWTDFQPESLLFDIYHHDMPKLIRSSDIPGAVITDQPERFMDSDQPSTVIGVTDIESAYWSFVSFYRGLCPASVIGVTGTCGKTTTKEMIRHILAQKMNVIATYKSLNAQARHFSYLMEFDRNTQAAVIEMGVAAPSDLIAAGRYFKPQVGVITNIGIDHLNAFGSQDRYINAKAEMIKALNYQGTLVVNADDENIRKIDFRSFKGRILTFGFDSHAEFRLMNVRQRVGSLECGMLFKGRAYTFRIPGYGSFLAFNAAAAIAAAYSLGIGVETSCRALESFQNVEKHFEVKKGLYGGYVIDDTWSSNPSSSLAALRMLKELAEGGEKTIAALGRMSLLGKSSGYYHAKTGEAVQKLGIDRLIVVGKDAREIGQGALEAGMNPEYVIFCSGARQAVEILKKEMTNHSITLVKTSMLASYEHLIDTVTAQE